MAIFVTMLQTRRGEGGSLWLAGSTYSASDAFAATLAGANLAVTAAVGTWQRVPSVTMRLRMAGVGTVRLEARDVAGVVTADPTGPWTLSGVAQIDFAYPGDDAVDVRLTTTGSAAAEII